MLGRAMERVRAVLLIAAVATAGMMMKATPAQARDEGCDTVDALDFQTGETVECWYCNFGGTCLGACEDFSMIEFPC